MTRKVLLVEDSASFSSMLSSLIRERHGYDVDVARDLASLGKLLSFGSTPEKRYFSAIVDLNLPDAPDGEALAVVKDANIPAIVFTGSNNKELQSALWSKGIADYAHKSSAYSLDYVVWMIRRLDLNSTAEVLIVDDALVARSTMRRMLHTQRFIVHEAKSGKEALEILSQQAQITMAIIDCHMPEMDGISLTAKMRESTNHSDIEIIGISSKGSREVSAQFIKAGANDFLTKPFTTEEFLCRVNHGIERIENYRALKTLNEEKNRLLGTAAHDIRGPIASIKTAADYILQRQPEEARRQQLMHMISNNAEDMLDLLSSLLDVSAIESGNLEIRLKQCDFVELLRDRVELYHAEAEAKSIAMSVSADEAVNIRLDKAKMKQVADNLITNAIKYSPVGGKVHLDVSVGDTTVRLSVRDSGPGISKDERQELFKPFKVLSTRTTAGEKQTGLGLAIAKRIVEAHNGEIRYQEAQEGGACFELILPLHEDKISR